MLTGINTSALKVVRSVAVAASLIALVMLLAFPALKARHFNESFRSSQTLSQIQRHIFVAQPEAGPALLAGTYSAPFALMVNLDAAAEMPMAGFQLANWVPLPRLLLRLKLGSSRATASDPLL
ncbi:MAG TPA: hypothetical protein VKB84_25720 [Candidatus Binataceae bacterium]|jgi:hypothetical protein|nr:hypothetical protein [Candidatus Binataceae bacterium]